LCLLCFPLRDFGIRFCSVWFRVLSILFSSFFFPPLPPRLFFVF
jgi:hypothetical protein